MIFGFWVAIQVIRYRGSALKLKSRAEILPMLLYTLIISAFHLRMLPASTARRIPGQPVRGGATRPVVLRLHFVYQTRIDYRSLIDSNCSIPRYFPADRLGHRRPADRESAGGPGDQPRRPA